MQSTHENIFWEQWPVCLNSMQDLYGHLMCLPDARFELFEKQLKGLRNRPTANEIEKNLRQLWDLDGRFIGDLLGYDAGIHEQIVYSLCYLCKDEEVIRHFLNIYIPLLGRFVKEALGECFRTKVGRTFKDDVGHYLWEVQGLVEPGDHELFDWHGNRNLLPMERIENFLQFADLPPLPNPDFPPRWVLLHFTNLQSPFDSESEYLQDLQNYYLEKGYSIRL